MSKLKLKTRAPDGTLQLPSGDPEAMDICADVFVALQVFGTLVDVMLPRYWKMGEERLKLFKTVMVVYDGVTGVLAVGLSAGAYANTPDVSKMQLELVLANTFSALSGIMALPNILTKDAKAKFAVWITRTVFCWTSAGLFIAAYEDRPSGLLEGKKEAGEDEAKDEILTRAKGMGLRSTG